MADMVKNDAVQFTCVVRVYCITSSGPLFLLILVSGKASSVERKNKKLESRPRGAIWARVNNYYIGDWVLTC